MSARWLHSNVCYRAISAVLDERGIKHRVEMDHRHPKVIFDVDGQEIIQGFSCTPSDRYAAVQAAAETRRRIKQATGAGPSLATEPAPAPSSTLPEKRTMSDSIIEVGLHLIEEQPRVLDTDLGERLGFDRADNIRTLIGRNRQELESFGPLLQVEAKSTGGRPGSAFYLNEEQALLLSIKSTAPRAPEVRSMLIKVFVAFRRGQLQPMSPEIEALIKRVDGISRMLSHKVTEIEKSMPTLITSVGEAVAAANLAMGVAEKMEGRFADVGLAPTFDLAATLTADQIIVAAGILPADRQKGTSQMVTRRMQDFCADRGVIARRTPEDLNPKRTWRFPKDAATKWLFGASMGAELIRNQIAARKAAKGKGRGQGALHLVPESVRPAAG